MWQLIIIVWTLSNGELQEREYRGNEQFRLRSECVEAGRQATNAFVPVTDSLIGVTFLYNPDRTARENHEG